jgi:hypothetical protein
MDGLFGTHRADSELVEQMVAQREVGSGQSDQGSYQVLYCSRTSQVPLTCSQDDDQARSSIVCLGLSYLIMVCLFRWLAVLAPRPPQQTRSTQLLPGNE